MSARRDPVSLEQALLRCECGEVLAIIEELGAHREVIYRWAPADEEEPPACHRNGVTVWQAEQAYLDDRCSDYFQAEITEYRWPDRAPTWEPIEPVLEPDVDEQLALETA